MDTKDQKTSPHLISITIFTFLFFISFSNFTASPAFANDPLPEPFLEFIPSDGPLEPPESPNEEFSTIIIGGPSDQCGAPGVGHWGDPLVGEDPNTCYLDNDLFETIRIDQDGITLDCEDQTTLTNHTIQGPVTWYPGSWGIYIPYGRTGVTIQNCIVKDFFYQMVVRGTSHIIQSNTIESTSPGDSRVGIEIQGNNNELYNNTIDDTYYSGIGVAGDNNIIRNNSLRNGIRGDGIGIGSYRTASFNQITSNNFTNNGWDGICVYWFGSNNTIRDNNFANNARHDGTSDIRIYFSSGNTLRNNTMESFLVFGVFADLENDVDTSNTVLGKPVYYFNNQTNVTFDYDGSDVGFFGCVNCSNVTIKNIGTPTNPAHGLLLHNVNNSTINNLNISTYRPAPNLALGILSFTNSDFNNFTNNNFSNNTFTLSRLAFHPFDSHNNTYENNSIRNGVSYLGPRGLTPAYGFVLYDSYDNTFKGNIIDIDDPSSYGISLFYYPTGNTFTDNTIINNTQGIYLWYVGGTTNIFYHNNIYNNSDDIFLYDPGSITGISLSVEYDPATYPDCESRITTNYCGNHWGWCTCHLPDTSYSSESGLIDEGCYEYEDGWVPPAVDLDFEIVDLQFSTNTPNLGEIVYIAAKVTNLGTDSASGVIVRFYNDTFGMQIDDDKTISILGGGTSTAYATWDTSNPGQENINTIRVIVDEVGSFNETNEGNNEATKDIDVVKPPTLTIIPTCIGYTKTDKKARKIPNTSS